MDLTRIVLPTFILERRSLLEMYADFFAHPDIFVEIPSKTTPADRMIQVNVSLNKLKNVNISNIDILFINYRF